MKNNFNLLLGIIATFLLFISCDKDFYEDVELQKNNLESIDVKTITYDEFKRKLKSLENKPAVKMIMNNTNSIRHFARSGDDSEIEIFTDVIKEITSGTYKSYTMYIKTSDTIASKFYNLTLEEKEGNTAAFITKYSPTENWLNDKNQPFEGGIATFRVEPGPNGSIKFTHFDEGGGGTSYPPYCDGVVVATTVFTEVLCGCGHTWQDYLMNLCTGCTTGYPSFPSFTQSTLYECISTPGSGYSPAGGSSPGSSQPGEPSNNSLTTIVGVPIIRPAVTYLADLLSLNGRQITFLSNNPVIEGQISNYISENTDSNNVVNPEAMAFALELINLAIQNPTFYTSENIINWFFTPREGQDFFYDATFWDNPNLSFPQQDLPTWDDFDLAYPRDNGADLVLIVGGAVQQAYNDYPSLSRGYCALKVSRALNYSGITIPQITTTANNPGTIQGNDGKYYFLNAKALNKWMKKTFGTNPATSSTPYNENHIHIDGSEGGENGINFPSLVSGLKGIYSMVSTNPQWASGHADLIQDGLCVFGCHFQDTPPAPIDYIDIWVLE